MIIFLYGQDTYRLGQKLKEIITEYKKIHQSGLNLRYFEGKNLDFQKFKDEFLQTSMFKEKKLIILKNIFQSPEFKEKLLVDIKKIIQSQDIVLISEKNKISSRDTLLKSLKKKANCQEFKLLKGQNLRNWAKKEIKKYGLKINSQSLEMLIDFIGNDLWRFSNEIKKIASFKNKDSNLEISKKEIELLIRPKIEPDIFKTIDFIASKKKKQALELLKKHLEKGESPLYLLSMINFQFRNLLIIRDLIAKNRPPYLISKEASLHPYVVKKSYPQARKFEISELKKIYQKIFEVDLKIKTGKIEPQVAIELLIAEI